MNRRRFLTLSAAFACAPHLASAATWTGRALGAQVSVTLNGPRHNTAALLSQIPALLNRIEAQFSLYRPDSALVRLNQTGHLPAPNEMMLDLFTQSDRAHQLTQGLFDPTVQPLWSALANGDPIAPVLKTIGWSRVGFGEDGIRLTAGQALTFNGIAQGFATDQVAALLKRNGAESALINIGEYAAVGGPFTLGLTDPALGHLGNRRLSDGAIATSSPGALSLGNRGHILSPDNRPALWSTVSIEGPSATLADALSTAAVFLPRSDLVRLKSLAGLTRITTSDTDGRLITL